jgi:hypothetical protein
VAAAFLNDAYRPKVEGAIVRSLKVGAVGLLILALLLFLIKFETFNRSLLVLFVSSETGMLIVARIGLSSRLALSRRAGKSARHALIVTADEPIRGSRPRFVPADARQHGGRSHARRHSDGRRGGATFGGGRPPIRGSVEEMADLLHEEVVDEVYRAPLLPGWMRSAIT